MSQVSYLGHVFSSAEMSPNQQVFAVNGWKIPTNVEEIRKFILYRQYIQGFSDIAKPLHGLTQTQARFAWSDTCDKAFSALKHKLVQALVLAYPQFESTALIFVTN